MINRASLLTALVGPEGAAALAKAAERLPQIDNAMAPRALFSWLSLAADGYEGEIPGIDESHLALKKSTRGFGGVVSVGAAGYEFEDASLLHVSAAIGVLGGIDGHRVDMRVSDDSLYRLGQTVDMLVKARSAHQSLLKSRDDIPAYDFEHEYDASQDPPVTTIYAFDKGKEVAKVVVAGAEGGHKIRSWTVDEDAHPTLETRLRDVVAHVTGSDLGKADPEGSKDRVDSPGPAHKPTAPAAPVPPDAPTNKAQQPSVQRGKKMGSHAPPLLRSQASASSSLRSSSLVNVRSAMATRCPMGSSSVAGASATWASTSAWRSRRRA